MSKFPWTIHEGIGQQNKPLLILNFGTECSRMVNFTLRPLCPRRTAVTNEYEAMCAPEPVGTFRKKKNL